MSCVSREVFPWVGSAEEVPSPTEGELSPVDGLDAFVDGAEFPVEGVLVPPEGVDAEEPDGGVFCVEELLESL